MSREKLRKHFYGPIATLPTAMNRDECFSLDLGRMAELTDWWLEQGLVAGRAPLKVAAAAGEGPDLDDEEWPQLLKTVVDRVNGRTEVICALKTKNTIHTIRDAKIAQDLGAVGLQIDLPIFHHPNQDDYVRFFSDISDAIEIGIMVYNTFWFGPPSLTLDTIKRLRDTECVVAMKWFVPPDGDYDLMREVATDFSFIDNSNQPVRGHQNGGVGYIDPTTSVYPPHALKVWDLCLAKKYDEAQELFDSVRIPLRNWMSRSERRSGGYNTPKAMMAIMGQPVGPPRPPTLECSPEEHEQLRELMIQFGWPVSHRKERSSNANRR